MKKTNTRNSNVIEEYKMMKDIMMTNKIYNMDCLEGLRMMPSDSVDLILSDPPYDMETKKGKGTGVVKGSKYLKEIDYMCKGFDLEILDECVRVLKRINAFFFCSRAQIPMYFDYFADKNVNIQLLTWSKTDAPPLCCGKYLSDTEYIIYVYEDSVAEDYKLITDHFITKRVRVNSKDPLYHPTKKSTDILSTLIYSASKEGDVVLDMFSGSASTAVSCIETNRRFIGFELMEKYHEVGNKRIEMALDEHPEYTYKPEPLKADKDNNILCSPNAFEDTVIDMAYFDVCGKNEKIPFNFIEEIIAKQKKPNLYIMLDMVQFPIVLSYFEKQNYKFDILTNHQKDTTKYILFLRKGGVPMYGTCHTKHKYFEDERDLTLPFQDNIPYELMQRLVINSSQPGDTIFCSGGYGTSIKVCADEGRHFIVYESDREKFMYCVDVIDSLGMTPTPLGGVA